MPVQANVGVLWHGSYVSVLWHESVRRFLWHESYCLYSVARISLASQPTWLVGWLHERTKCSNLDFSAKAGTSDFSPLKSTIDQKNYESGAGVGVGMLRFCWFLGLLVFGFLAS